MAAGKLFFCLHDGSPAGSAESPGLQEYGALGLLYRQPTDIHRDKIRRQGQLAKTDDQIPGPDLQFVRVLSFHYTCVFTAAKIQPRFASS